MSRPAAALLCLLFACALGCGKYGPPVRAGAEPAAARKPSFEVPQPSAPREAPPEAAPEPALPVEQEPPLEGAP